MGKRKTASVFAVVFSVVGLAACLTHASANPGPTSDAGAVNALAKLHGWLNKPGSADMNVYAFETTTSADPASTALQLAGDADLATGTLQLTGQQQNVGTGTITQSEAVASDGVLYSTVVPQPRPDGIRLTGPMRWTSTAMSSVRPNQSKHSLWWLALQSLNAVYRDGSSVVSTKGATEFTGTVDLAKVPGIPSSFLNAPLFEKAHTTRVAVDLYTISSDGSLARLTYRFGLSASVDSKAVGQSTAGYQVDLYIWAPGQTAPPSTTAPVKVPEARYLVPGGNEDLCRLLIF